MQKKSSADSLVFVFSNGYSRRGARSFAMQNLDPAKKYQVKKLFSSAEESTVMSGDELMRYGIPTVTPENQHVRHLAALYSVCEVC